MATSISISEAVPTRLLGARIRQARKTASLSHDSLGALVGTTRQHLIRLEQGLHRPKDDLLERIANATDTQLATLTRKPVYRPRAARELSVGDRERLADATAPLAAALIEILRDKIAAADGELEEEDDA